ncbi:hypothetical protein FH972_022718 [Carpinus fangiana]|uniref:Uncharacterized protein n=1 Tax=Carpinus fangiana TaxID=176857 RepID=A0A5N6KTJ9_9ROSI|nr:hypothetical protein FH972_022718 [Carpinus fangiana]
MVLLTPAELNPAASNFMEFSQTAMIARPAQSQSTCPTFAAVVVVSPIATILAPMRLNQMMSKLLLSYKDAGSITGLSAIAEAVQDRLKCLQHGNAL